MATPAIQRLREAEPAARIHAVTLRRSCYELLSALPIVDEVHLLPYWEGRAVETVVNAVRLRGSFDVSFLAYPSVRAEYHVLAAALGAKKRVAHDYRPSIQTMSFLESDRVPILADDHNVVNNLRLLRALDIDDSAQSVVYQIPSHWRAEKPRAKTIAFHLGTVTHKGNENKRWPVENFIQLARHVSERGFDIAVVDGPMERDITAEFVQAIPNSMVVAGNLEHVARELSAMTAVVAADNGIAHLSAAVGTDIIALFGMTDPRRCGPWGEHTTIVRPSDCPPCFSFGDGTFACKRDIDFRCMRVDLSVDAVVAALAPILDESGRYSAAT